METIDLPVEFLSATDHTIEEQARFDQGRIIDDYHSEMSQTGSLLWEACMMPFLALGSGDSICVDTRHCEQCPVTIYDHEDGRFAPLADSFDDWIKSIPEFFRGW